MAEKSLRKNAKYVAMAGLGLISGAGNVAAQEAQTREPNHVYTNLEHTMTGESSVVKRVIHPVYLGPNSEYDLQGIFGYHAGEGNLTNRVISFEEGVQNLISDMERRGEDDATLNYYRQILEAFESNDSISMNVLERAVQDGIIHGHEISEIENGVYLIVPTSQNINGKKRMGGATLLDVKYFPKYDGREPLTHESLLTGPEIVSPTIQTETENTGDIGFEEALMGDRTERVAARFSFDGTRNLGEYPNAVGGQVGIGYGPASLILNYTDVKDENLENITVPLSNGRKGVGSNDRIDRTSFGVGLEANFGPFILGGGINLDNYTIKTIERIETSNGEVLRDNSLSRTESNISVRAYGGLEIPLSENVNLRGFAGVNESLGKFGGLGLSIETHKHKNQKHRTQHRE